ncbi:MAG: hypothetical protein GX542_07650, partial [Rhodococcus sp.]|nr:hypothetical protein [Rhodococcus sp. (in: high G+C Gram-positive bacteria)]
TTIFDLQTTGATASTSLRRRLLDAIGDLTVQSSVVPDVRFAGAIDTLVPARIHAHAEAVLREALSNALRHAQAKTVDIAVTADSNLTLVISDDGVGISDSGRRSGLENMSRRAQQCGGTCTITSATSGASGTTTPGASGTGTLGASGTGTLGASGTGTLGASGTVVTWVVPLP